MPPRNKRNTRDNRKSTKRHNAEGRRGILLGAGILLAIAAGWLVWRAFPKAPEIRNVLLISIDTCRADHLSCYGYPDKTTPNIDAIAAEGTLFRNAHTPIPMTLPAHCSMLTGTIPPVHGIHDNLQYGFSGEEATLAKILKARGFRTGGIVSTFILDRRYGLDQGFDEYMDNMPARPRNKAAEERKGGDTTRLALDFLQGNFNKPFFLFLHYYDAHAAYAPPEPFASRFRDSPYAGEIAYVDDCFGRVVAKLKELGLYDSTLLVITGDHGEMLGEHGEEYHSFFIYEGAVKVPLVVRRPGQKQGHVVEEPVGLVDIVPTICGLLRVQLPSRVQGVDLTSRLKGGKKAQRGRYYYCESLTPTKYGANSLLGLVQNNWKYIQTTHPRLYDLEKDPREENNLASSRPELAAGLKSQLKSLLEREARAHKGGNTAEWDAKAIANLAALGYVQGSVTEDFTFSEDKEDPADLIGFHRSTKLVQMLIKQKQYAKAGELCRELVAQRPAYDKTYSSLAAIAFEQRDFGAAVEALTKAIELNPRDFTHHKNIAPALVELGRMDEAFQHFQEAEKLEPRSSEVLTKFGLALNRVRRFDEAIRKFQKAIELDPKGDLAYQGLAESYLAQGKMDDAILESAKALELNPSDSQIRNNLARLYSQKGDRQKAAGYWADSLRLNPNQPAIMDLFALDLLEQGRVDEALECWQSFLRADPANSLMMSRIALVKANPKYPQHANPAEALALARRACEITNQRDLLSLYALAVSLAGSQRFQEAAEAASKALKLAEAAGDSAVQANIRALLESCARAQPGKETGEPEKRLDRK
jgi:arylsulfatase A-like enzyme/Flp pilus assembly protein TadD